MELKSGIKGRREERIRSLLTHNEEPPEEKPPLFALPEPPASFREWGAGPDSPPEPDPEALWKQRRQEWEQEGGGDRPRFTAGLLRRIIASAVVFAAVGGIFTLREPWALSAQAFVTDMLSRDMDFAAVQVWYEEHFNGAPSFIPMFDEEGVPAEKVSAVHELETPLSGTIVRPFGDSRQGVEVMPLADSNENVTVKSVDVGRVLSVTKEPQGGVRVTIRHGGALTAEYGHLSGTRLAADDWVESGDAVGWLKQSDGLSLPLFFFAVMKDKVYVDPAEVVSFE
ncbi:peptidoglycan DD-metalloendopeptidase family protein [Paenibacillus tengchongensis]|uniref:peptidoglycan DD-metalloendopeptidase family protein n=1 Tax=Paenibacillus tengchongensis TaxID=2608684 RepID=UPI00165253F2|nr:peptidoglycan DD-metalloendopeptidase family protein [Paenibacillus tengchongensis]